MIPIEAAVKIKEATGGKLIYLASPYTHPEPTAEEYRFKLAVLAAGRLLQCGVPVFSPIVHGHSIAVRSDLPREYAFWQAYDRLYLEACGGMVVLQAPGWECSKGVTDEIDVINQMEKPTWGMTIENNHWPKMREVDVAMTAWTLRKQKIRT